MHKIALRAVYTVLIALFCSCEQFSTKEVKPTQEELAQTYYKALNSSDFVSVGTHIADSITQISGSYKESWSRNSFTNWLEWDASFKPEYKVYETRQIAENQVQLTVSKTCKRIQFLNEEPTKYVEVFHFNNNKIREIEAGESIVFNDSLWVAKRDTLIAFIKRNHQELDGFIFDQTKKGAQDYLKAITLFKQAQKNKGNNK